MAKAKKIKQKLYRYYGFNIVLTTNKVRTDKSYFDLIRALFTKAAYVLVTPDKRISLRTQSVIRLKYKEVDYEILSGKVVRYTLVEGDDWYSEDDRGFQKVDIPQRVYPSPVEAEYIFLPSVHRFYIKVNGKVTWKMVKIFLEEGLKLVLSTGDSIKVNLMQSHGIIQEILNADEITKLHVEVAYSNDDIGSDAKEDMETLLKEGGIGNASLTITPDKTGRLKENSKIVKGFLELAKDNGQATATIVNKGKKKRVVTKNYPSKVEIKGENDEAAAQNLLKDQMQKNR